MEKWEYCKVDADHHHTWVHRAGHKPQLVPEGENDKFLELLDGLGNEGWELVSAGEDGECSFYYFKRRRPSQIGAEGSGGTGGTGKAQGTA